MADANAFRSRGDSRRGHLEVDFRSMAYLRITLAIYYSASIRMALAA